MGDTASVSGQCAEASEEVIESAPPCDHRPPGPRCRETLRPHGPSLPPA